MSKLVFNFIRVQIKIPFRNAFYSAGNFVRFQLLMNMQIQLNFS